MLLIKSRRRPCDATKVVKNPDVVLPYPAASNPGGADNKYLILSLVSRDKYSNFPLSSLMSLKAVERLNYQLTQSEIIGANSLVLENGVGLSISAAVMGGRVEAR